MVSGIGKRRRRRGGGNPFVTRQGAELRLNNGSYRFTGLNIYNANSIGTCWYDMGYGTELEVALAEMGTPGPTGTMGVFRAWFFQAQATTSGFVRDWAAMDHTLQVAAAYGYRVIACLGNQWGDCENPGGASSFRTESWYSSGYTSEVAGRATVAYRAWVQEVVARYKGNPTILMWQIMNEAEPRTAPWPGGTCSATAHSTLVAFATDIGNLIKSIDSNHLVNVGTMGNGQCGAEGSTQYRALHNIAANDICELHDYGGTAALPGDAFNGTQVRINDAAAIGKPIFVGEMGIDTDATSFSQRTSVYQAKINAQMSQAGVVGYLPWTWKSASQGGSTLADFGIGPSDGVLNVLRSPPSVGPPATTLLNIDFEGASAAADGITEAYSTGYNTAYVRTGTNGWGLTNGQGGLWARHTFTAQAAATDLYARIYYRPAGSPALGLTALRLGPARLWVGTDGVLRVADDGGTVRYTHGSALTAAAWARLELHVNVPASGVGTIEAKLAGTTIYSSVGGAAMTGNVAPTTSWIGSLGDEVSQGGALANNHSWDTWKITSGGTWIGA